MYAFLSARGDASPLTNREITGHNIKTRTTGWLEGRMTAAEQKAKAVFNLLSGNIVVANVVQNLFRQRDCHPHAQTIWLCLGNYSGQHFKAELLLTFI